jgi:tetratricopeptide (TPR) repeat protein
MPRRSHSLLLVLVVSCVLSTRGVNAQTDRIEIAAGTEEDHALQAITAEQDPQKKLAMFQEFVQKFSANPSAVTYGNWQISQAYQAAGDLPKALDYGDKALVASPHNLDILVSQASLAQQAKDNAKLISYAVKGGEACRSIGKEAKPAATSDEDFAKQVAEEKDAAKNNCEFLETSGFNVVASETDPKLRMADIEAFTAAFPDSKYQDQVSNYAMYTLGPGQLNDATRLVAFGEKTLAANPKSLPALLLLASVYVEEPKPASVAKAISYSQRAIDAAKPDAADADKPRKLSAGVAHSTIGYAYMKQEKTVAAIAELKAAVALLKGQDDVPYSVALYRLGYAYAKLVRNTEAREVLMEAVKIQGPVQAASQELLNKVNVARAKGK